MKMNLHNLKFGLTNQKQNCPNLSKVNRTVCQPIVIFAANSHVPVVIERFLAAAFDWSETLAAAIGSGELDVIGGLGQNVVEHSFGALAADTHWEWRHAVRRQACPAHKGFGNFWAGRLRRYFESVQMLPLLSLDRDSTYAPGYLPASIAEYPNQR